MCTSRPLLGALKIAVCLSTVVTIAAGPAIDAIEQLFALLWIVILASLGLRDAVVNDILLSQFAAPGVKKWGHLVFIALAGTQMSLIYAEVLALSTGANTVWYIVNAVASTAVAARSIRAQCRIDHQYPYIRE